MMTALEPIHWLRWGQYADLALVFGVPFTALATGGVAVLPRVRPILAGTGLLGLAIGAAAFLQLVANMAGTALFAVDPALLETLLTSSAIGWAALARAAALLAFLAVIWGPPPLMAWGGSLLGAIAAGAAAWSSHAAATEGTMGLVHLGSDIVHVLAASAWFGALALLLAVTRNARPRNPDAVALAARMLAAFSRAGTVIVALLVLTGIANAALMFAPSDLPQLVAGLYGRLLIGKLILFGGMLGLAALNRYRLAPALDRARAGGETGRAIRELRLSLALEFSLAITILLLVAWLGTLDPLPMAVNP